MAMHQFPFIQRLTLHILPFMVLPDKIRDTKICLKEDLKEGLGVALYIDFYSIPIKNISKKFTYLIPVL